MSKQHILPKLDLDKTLVPENLTFGWVLRTIRLNKEISLRELARRLNLSASYLSDIELDRRKPNLNLIRRLSKELNFNFVTLLYHARKSVNLPSELVFDMIDSMRGDINTGHYKPDMMQVDGWHEGLDYADSIVSEALKHMESGDSCA